MRHSYTKVKRRWKMNRILVGTSILTSILLMMMIQKTEEAVINPAAMIGKAVQNFMREFGVRCLSLRSYLSN